MIELPVGPEQRVVAALASGREPELYVVHRSESGVVILKVTRDASGGRQVVIAVEVAVRANSRRIGMRIRQREAHGSVIEGRRLPGRRRVALLTSLRDSAGNVVRVFSALVIRQVAAHAGRGRDVVIVVDVAVRANPRRIGVRIRQRKAHCKVIERRRLPRDSRVALLTSLRKTSRDVIRVCRGLKVL